MPAAIKSSRRSNTGSRPFVAFPENLTRVRIVKRLNRFVIEVTRDELNGPYVKRQSDNEPTDCRPGVDAREHGRKHGAPWRNEPSISLHMPNTGRMQELLTPGTLGLASLDAGKERKTAGTLLLVRYRERWVSVDARMPNRLFDQCLTTNYSPPFDGYDEWRAEVPWGRGRVDFKLTAPDKPPFLVETKSCNLVEDGLALFPDAPTERGARHLLELTDAVKQGFRAAVVWFVQRDDANRLAPHQRADPAFTEALYEARAAGVEAYAYRCRVSPGGIEVLDLIPVVQPRDPDPTRVGN